MADDSKQQGKDEQKGSGKAVPIEDIKDVVWTKVRHKDGHCVRAATITRPFIVRIPKADPLKGKAGDTVIRNQKGERDVLTPEKVKELLSPVTS